ncbi:MAG: hypothetical protein NC818_00305 [Candidatus Omnitrophica bacterium]|nr:hypothetical protein [Candidatus Omnitrophota bacterium]
MRQIFRTLLTAVFVLLLFVMAIALFYLASEKRKITNQYNKDRELWTIRNNALRESLKKSEEDILNLKKELEGLNVELKKANDELSALRLSYENLNKENLSLNQKINVYSREREGLLQKIARLEQDLRMVQNTKAPQEESWATLLKEKVDLQMRINEVEEKLKNNRLLITQLETERRKLGERLSGVQLDKIGIEKNLGSGGTTKSTSPRDILKANLEKENMEQKLADLAIEKDNLEERIISLKEEVDKADAERDVLNTQIERINQLLEEKLSQINKVREELESALKEAKRIALAGTSPVELPPVVVKKGIAEGTQKLPPPPRIPPPRTEQANIVLVNEKYNFVIINVGKSEGVVEGMLFDLYENKENIGQIKIKEVRERLSAGEIVELKKGKSIKSETTLAIYSP